jgi:thymidylate synthase
MKQYLQIIQNVLDNGILKPNRTKFKTISTTGEMFKHDMRTGYPLITTKFVPIRLVASELEMFIKGITSKKFLQDRNNHIWDQWCNPQKVQYSNDDSDIQQKMLEEDDLGPIYGYNWRYFGKPYDDRFNSDITGIDQLKNIVNTIKKNPSDRRMICTAWDPISVDSAALPPCHHMFQVVCQGENFEFLDLIWHQRSADSFLGVPFDIASYGILLELLAKETNKIPRLLIGTFADTHIYENHIEQCNTILSRTPYELPSIEFTEFTSIFDFKYTDVKINNYSYHEKIKAEIAI